MGRNPYRGAAKPNPRPDDPTIGIPGMPGVPAISPATDWGAAVQLETNDAVAEGVVAGATAQLCGTDNDPIVVPRPIPANTPPPRLAEPAGPTALIPAPGVRMPGPSAAPEPEAAPAALRARMTDRSAPTWVMPAKDIGVSELLMRFVAALVTSPGPSPGETPGAADCNGAANLCNVLGVVETTWDSDDCTLEPDADPMD